MDTGATMLKKPHALRSYAFGDLVKYLYFLKFYDDSRNVFVIYMLGRLVFGFVILRKHVHMRGKFQRTLISTIPFILKHLFMNLTNVM